MGAPINLVNVIELAIGFAIIVGILIIGSKFYGTQSKDNSELLPELITAVAREQASLDDEALTRSIRLYPRDLFLFYSKGYQPIRLEFQGPGTYDDFSFTRPEECLDETCICYCKDGPYWQPLDEEPYLYQSQLVGGKEFTCIDMTCQVLSQETYFANSQGSTNYMNSLTNSFGYQPVSMDVVLLLHYFNKNNRGNPFFGTSGQRYDATQQSPIYLSFLNNYKWKGGYVLGGYGAAITDRDKDKREIQQPLVTLRLENKGENIMGICLQDECLFKQDADKLLEERKLIKVQEQTLLAYNNFRTKLERAPTCLESLPKGADTFTCDPLSELYSLFTVEDIEKISPQMTFTLETDQEAQRTYTTITFTHAYKEFSSLTTPLLFACENTIDFTTRVQSMTVSSSGLDFNTYATDKGDCSFDVLETLPQAQT